jgi:hypothetical protein
MEEQDGLVVATGDALRDGTPIQLDIRVAVINDAGEVAFMSANRRAVLVATRRPSS